MTIFDILTASLFTGEPVELDDWELSFKEMRQQTVAALPYGVLPADAREWRQYCLRERARAVRVLHAQDQLLRLLEAHGVECVIIKGAAAAMAYPQPTLRSMGDVDLLVRRADLARAAALLEGAGTPPRATGPGTTTTTPTRELVWPSSCTGGCLSYRSRTRSGLRCSRTGSTGGSGARWRGTGSRHCPPPSTGWCLCTT